MGQMSTNDATNNHVHQTWQRQPEPLTKPHSQQFRTLDTDEVGLALISNGLGQQGLSTPCNTTLL